MPYKPGDQYYTDSEDWVTFCCAYDPLTTKEEGTATGLEPGTDYLFRVRAHLKLTSDTTTTHSPFGRWGPYSRPVVLATDSIYGLSSNYPAYDANSQLSPTEHTRQVVQHPQDPHASAAMFAASNAASYGGHGHFSGHPLGRGTLGYENQVITAIIKQVILQAYE